MACWADTTGSSWVSQAEGVRVRAAKDMARLGVSTVGRRAESLTLYLQVVTTALSVSRVLHLSELQRRAKSMALVQLDCNEVDEISRCLLEKRGCLREKCIWQLRCGRLALLPNCE